MTTRAALSVVLAAMLLGLAAPVALAADVSFGRASAEAEFGRRIEFVQPVTVAGAPARVELRLRFADALGPQVIEVAPPTSAGEHTLRYSLEFAEGGHLHPNTTITAWWRVYEGPDDLRGTDGPTTTLTYADDRFQWRTVSGDIVRVHWYEGSDAFGRRALEIGERAVRETADLLGVTEEDPIDFFVYGGQAEFYDALGPGTRENVGGQANAEIRTLFALITPGEIDDPWVDIVVPHELVHLVFDTTVGNPYHFPPRWLNEGLAVYLSQGYDATDRATVEAAARAGTLIPLDGITGQFPTTRDRFYLAYAESVSAVDFFIRTYGRDALVSLIRSYGEGRTDDEAFRDAIGIDAGAFGDAWLADLDAAAPRRYGPQPAPPGPQPPGWEAAPATPGSGPVGTAGPGAPAPGPDPEPGATVEPVVIGAVLLLLVGGVALAIGGARRRRGRPA
jgi:hypothetical protein